MPIKSTDRNREKNHANDTRDENKIPNNGSAKVRAHNFQHIMHKKQQPRRFLVRHSTTGSIVKKTSPKHSAPEHLNLEKSENVCVKFSDRDFSSHQSVNIANQEIEKIGEKNTSVIANAAIGSGRADDINYLIKKLTVNFNTKYQKARFSITEGVFAGANFSLLTNENELVLKVNNASETARQLLKANKYHLKNSLAEKEINLRELLFL